VGGFQSVLVALTGKSSGGTAVLGLSCHLASPSLSGTTDPPRFYDDSSSARHSSQAHRQPLNRRPNHDRAWGGFCNKPETRTVSLTVMLIGLAIEEDTKKSKRGCEALAISFLTWSVVCQAARSATSSASNGPGRRAWQRWLCFPNIRTCRCAAATAAMKG